MCDDHSVTGRLIRQTAWDPAQPLWHLVPTHGCDGHCLADFMMLIPGLRTRSPQYRDQVAQAIREVCETFGDRVAFADINIPINVLWVSVVAEPGLAGRVAASVREQVPEALLIGGQLGAVSALQASSPRSSFWRRGLRRLSRRAALLLAMPRD